MNEETLEGASGDEAGGTPLVPDELPRQGDRAIIVGQTGQGKTQFACWLLERLAVSPIVIYDTKGEPTFERMARATLVHSHDAMLEALKNPSFDYVVFRVPPQIIAEPDQLDGLLWYHFHNLRGVDCYIDELFSFTQNGRAGPGLVALLTQGRVHGFTVIMAVQRPALISRFPLTESQHFYVFFLVDEKDKQRLADVIPDFDELPPPAPYHFYYYRAGDRGGARLVAPILLDSPEKGAYKPLDTGSQDNDEPDAGTSLNWL